MEQLIKEHSLHLEKNNMSVNGVTNVESFDCKMIVADLINNSVTIKGDSLAVVDLDIKSQTLIIKGSVNSIVYGKKQEKTSFFKKIFK